MISPKTKRPKTGSYAAKDNLGRNKRILRGVNVKIFQQIHKKRTILGCMGQGIVNRLKSRGQSAIDEFQAIANYPEQNVEELMRTYVQDCRNAVFIFSGSQKSMTSEMFSSPTRPIYQSVSMMFLKPVDLPKYEDFANRHFEKAGKKMADGVVNTVYERFEGTTWYLQNGAQPTIRNKGQRHGK